MKSADALSADTAINVQGRAILAMHKDERSANVDLPVVQPCKLVLLLVIPFLALFAVILVTQTAADRASSREFLRNIIPLHPIPSKLNRELVLLRRPFPLLLWRSR